MTAAKRIFDDLLDLEINVIVKPGMTARKMPGPAHALLDIIGEYNAFLCRTSARINTVLGRETVLRIPVRVKQPYDPRTDVTKTDPSDEPALARESGRADAMRTGPNGWLRGPLQITPVDDSVSVETFDRLREWAVEAEAAYRLAFTNDWLPEDETPILLKRIYRNCDQLKGMLRLRGGMSISRQTAAASELDLSSDEVITVRKIWDVGTEVVMMQSVVQIDGDVVTRIQKGREGAAYKPIHDLHREAVGNAIRHWQFLGQTVAQLLTSVLKSFFSR